MFLVAITALAIQVIDILPGLAAKHISFDLKSIEQSFGKNRFNTEVWDEFFDKCSGIKTLNAMRDYTLAAFCERNGWRIDMSISSSHFNGGDDLNSIYEANNSEIIENTINGYAYITDDIERVYSLFIENDKIRAYDLGDYFVLVSDDIEINTTEPLEIPEWQALAKEFVDQNPEIEILAADHTDENWKKGISLWNDKKVILFDRSNTLLFYLKKYRYIRAKDEIFLIEKIESDGNWIRVYVDHNASVCQWPALLALLKEIE